MNTKKICLAAGLKEVFVIIAIGNDGTENIYQKMQPKQNGYFMQGIDNLRNAWKFGTIKEVEEELLTIDLMGAQLVIQPYMFSVESGSLFKI